ncbi:MAG: DUF1326 domain-containing protein [Planctomyces sp.]|nr:DUF1326 domain-containing protein [Planctomyces sp.]
MRQSLLPLCILALAAASADAAQIRGHYIESRTCDVYTGPCFANAEMALAGREAVMAWKVEEGGWNDVALDGLSVGVVLRSERNLGTDGVFPAEPGRIDSVVLVDERATSTQESALLAFVKHSAPKYTENIARVLRVPMTLEIDHATCKARFSAQDIARIETRKLEDFDCICSNELIYYQPLNELLTFKPAYTLTQSFQGRELDSRWTLNNTRSAFLATFRN